MGAKAREKKMEKAGKAGGGSQLKQQGAALNIKCFICYNSFMCTTRLPELKEHVANKHPKKTFEECFKEYDPNSAANAQSEESKKKKGNNPQKTKVSKGKK